MNLSVRQEEYLVERVKEISDSKKQAHRRKCFQQVDRIIVPIDHPMMIEVEQYDALVDAKVTETIDSIVFNTTTHPSATALLEAFEAWEPDVVN